MTLDETNPVRLRFAGHRTRIASRILSGALLALLTILGFTAGLPTHLSPAVDSSTEIPATSTLPGSHQDGQSPHFVGADNLTDLSLPKTVLSSVDDLIETGGVVQASPDNLTIYNLGISMRLLGGQVPHDELLGADGTVLSYWSFWGVEANLTGGWVPLLPTTNDFTVLGTNSSGAHVIRQMRLESGLYSGDFQITYKATSAGLLKWNLGFIPTTSGQYRLTYSWLNLPRRSFLQADLRSLTAGYGSGNYTFSWSDVPSGLASTPSLSSNLFSLAIGLGTVAADQKITIDPTVASNVYSSATGYTFQRKIFFDPKAGNYWAFYDDGMNTRTKYSHDGTFWSDPSSGGTLPSQFNTPYVDLEMSGQQVIAAVGQSYGNTLPSPWSHTVQGLYSVGTITGTSISWSSIYGIDSGQSWTCGNGSSSCSMTLGIRYVNVNIGPDGTLTFAYNFYVAVDVMVCTGTQYYSYLYVRYKGATRAIAGTGGGQYCIPVDSWDQDRNVVLPYSQGRVRVVFQYRGTGDTVALQSNWFDGANVGPGETIESTVPDGPEFSAAPDSTYDINVAYKMNDGTVNHAFLSSAATSWIHYPNIFSGLGASPTVTVDQSTNDVYVFALRSGGIVMRSKAVSRNWTDTSAVFSVTFRNTPTNLTSNPISASATNSSSILLFWTEGTGPYIAAFASIPIQSVWSPYSSPSDPWDGNGIAPYGQYFANLGESVSPSTGLLTVRQTDLSVPGRGLNLEVTRFYTEPYSFLAGVPFNFEKYPWAPMGDGWQLNYPWMNSTARPLYIHLWNGEGYRIPWSFWTSPTSTIENHQGEHFRLTGSADGSISLYDKMGTLYYFNTTLHELARITDSTGNNTITFSYNSNKISCITDTVGRAFTFSYPNGLLQSISQVAGSCSSPGSLVRTVSYSYSNDGQSLTSVTDPAQRVTSYSYNATTGSVAPWLLSRIKYPTSWLTNYTYTQVPLGTTAYTYRVNLQKTGPSSASPVRQLAYVYSHPVGDYVTNSTVTTYNGTRIVSYTLYAFSFAGISQNVTDQSHIFVRGVVQRFGVNGEVPREIVLVSPTQGYTNYYSYDLWGNLIYGRRTISSTPARFHESFSSYYNNGISPGFYTFQDTFSQGNYTRPDNPWSTYNGTWFVKSGVYNGTSPVFNPPNQDFFAWVNFTGPNLSIISSVYVTKRMATQDQRVGLFTHYPGSGLRKWGLVLHNSTTGMKLSLLDENVAWIVENPCTPLSYNTWYRFNFTISGSQAWGSATAPGISCSVSGTFTSTDITTATGLGLYAGGYSTLFDNVTLTTVAPAITGTVFSNSFIQNGSPNSNIHGSLAGTAEFQNGTASAPIETYYSYFPWGGLNQAKQLYNSPTGTQWPTSSRIYDWYGNIKSITDPRGNQTLYGYSSRYNSAYLTSQNQTLLPGSILISRLYGYNITTGNILNITDAMNNVVRYQNDNLGRTTKITYPTGDYASYKYNDLSNYVNITNENLWRTQQFYDGLSRLSKIQRYTGGFGGGIPYSNQTYTYNWQDRVINQKDDLGNMYNYTYDLLGRLDQTKLADGNITQVSYNDVSSWVVYTDEYLNHHCNTYDRLGRLLSVVEYSNSTCSPMPLSGNNYVTNYSYDEVGNLRKTVTASSKATSYYYDNLNRLSQTANPDTTAESYRYDNNGDLVSKTDRNGNQTSYSYDSLSRVQVIKYYERTVTNDTYTYDKNSNLVKLQSQNATLSYAYDSRNRVTCEKYAINGATTITGPCGSGGGGSVAAGTLITLANGTSIPVQGLSIGMSVLSYNVTTGRSAVSTITSLVTVDTDNMLVIRTQNSTPLRVDNATAQKLWVKTSSGLAGWLSVTRLRPGDSLFLPLSQKWTLVTSIEKAAGGNHLMYDIYTTSPGDYIADGYLDPVKQGPTPPTPPGITAAGYSFTYSYNGETLSQITYNDMDVVSYAYDSLGRVRNVTQSPVSPFLLVKLSYYRNDQVSNMTYGSGVKASYAYDKLARPLNITYYGSRQLLSLVYSYNKTGTVASVVGQVNGTRVNEQYRYDALQRLTNATIANGAVNSTFWYQYDSAGNRINQCCIALTNSSFSPTNNELLQTSRRISPGHYATSASYAYDSDGNLKSANITSLAPPAHWTYVWSPQGNLLRVSNYTSIQGLYAYDGLGRRVEAKEGSSTTFYAYKGTDTLAEMVPSAPSPDYVYANGIRIARTGGTVSTTYYITDALGSTRVVTDTSGSVVFSDNYQPFGSDNTSKGSETYKFTGKPVSQTTGLYYEYQRWYDPTIGRFISQDPLAGHLSNPQSLNPYVYVQNTPTTYADPSGMSIASPNLHGSNCPAIWQASFWSNPLGSIGCSFGFGPSGTVIGGGAGGAGEAGGPILGWGLFGIWAGVEIYSNWGTITTDWGNLWGTSQTGRAGTDNGGGGSNGGETTTTPRITGGTGSTTILPNVGGSVWSTWTPSINMGKGPPDRNPDYDWTKFPGRQPPRPTPTIRGEFSSRRIPRPVCGALALSVGIGVTAFASQLVNEQTTERGGGTGAALVALFFGTTGGTYALCATL